MQPILKRKAGLKTLALTLALCAGILASTQSQPAPAPPQSAPQLQPVSLEASQPLFSANGRTYTAGEWEELIKYNPPGPMARYARGVVELNQIPSPVLEEAIKEWTLVQTAAAQARAAGVELTPEQNERIARDLENVAIRVWIDINKIFEVDEPTEEAKKQYYEENKEQFKQHEELTLRHIFFSTYQEHTVEEGESLESIAQKISGDSSKADAILSLETKKPRAEAMEGAEEAGAKPLQPGEKLLVPMSDEASKALEQKAAAVSQRIKGGEEFMKVAQEVSAEGATQNMMVVRPKADNKPILPEVRETFDKLQDGGISEPIRTKHGYQIIMRVKYQPEGYVSYEDLEDRIANQLSGEARQEKLDNILLQLWKDDSEIRMNEEVLDNVFAPENAQKVIFQLGDVKYIASQFIRDFGQMANEETPREERRELLVRLPMVQRYLIGKDIDAKNLRENPIYKERAALVENDALASKHLNDLLADRVGEPSQEELQAKFDEMRESLEKQPSAEAWQIVYTPTIEASPESTQYEARVTEEVETLRKKLEDVKITQDFQAKIPQLSEESGEKAGHLGRIRNNHMQGLGARVLQDGENGLKGPFFIDGKIYALWLDNRTDTTKMTVEESKDTLTQRIKNEKMQKEFETVKNELMEDSGLQILYTNAE